MDDGTKYILLFIGGVIWAMRSSTKAYAPTLNTVHGGLVPERKPTFPPYGGPSSQSSCPDGTKFEIGIGRNFCTPTKDDGCPPGQEPNPLCTISNLSCCRPIQVEGGSCMSSFGPGYYEREGIENQKKWGKCLKCPTSWHIFPAGMVAGPPPQFDENGIQIMYNKEHCKGITKLTGVGEVIS